MYSCTSTCNNLYSVFPGDEHRIRNIHNTEGPHPAVPVSAVVHQVEGDGEAALRMMVSAGRVLLLSFVVSGKSLLVPMHPCSRACCEPSPPGESWRSLRSVVRDRRSGWGGARRWESRGTPGCSSRPHGTRTIGTSLTSQAGRARTPRARALLISCPRSASLSVITAAGCVQMRQRPPNRQPTERASCSSRRWRMLERRGRELRQSRAQHHG